MGGEHSTDIREKLALERTNLAHERTMMAWIRTATALISFGFSIYKFFALERAAAAPGIKDQIIGPQLFAILLINEPPGLFSATRCDMCRWAMVKGFKRFTS